MATGGVAVSNKVGATLKLNLQFMVPSGSIKDHLSTILIAVPEAIAASSEALLRLTTSPTAQSALV